MQFDTTYLTEAGRSLATGTLGGLDKIQFTRAVASSHDYSATPVSDLKKLTSIEDVQQTVDYSRIIKKDDTTLTMRVDFPSKDVTTAYSLYTVGFYARPENGDEILYGVLPSSLPDYIAAYDGKSNLNDSFQTDTTVSDADNVLITVSQAGSLNEADLDAIFASKHIATIDDIKANIPATVIDGSKPADFKEAVTLEKGAVDGAGNAVATIKDLADGDAETLKSAKDYADTKVSGKADDSTVVHTADMRKPASDVAGIEEVNAKQDKIGYTPADDSKVLHNSGLAAMPNDNSALVVGNNGDIGLVKQNGTSGAFGVGAGNTFHVVQSNNASLSWGDTFHDMFKINGNYQISLGPGAYFTPADDSKVAHLSGSNNFDTVPTVNNNPLLLASSLPSDLARTGQDANFTGKLQQNGQNVALVNNTIARNPDTGSVSEPVDFTKLTVNGGKSVATSDDLKSIRLKMWHEIKLPDMFVGSPILMKYNPDDRTTMILGAKNATLKDGASWTGTLFTLPEGFHWIKTDSNMMHLYNMDSYNDNVSGRLYNTKLSRSGSSSDGSKFGIWFTSLSSSIISIDNPYTTVSSIQPD